MTEKIRSNWPKEVTDTLESLMQKTSQGCGGCCHSDWIHFEGKWVIGICRQGMKLEFIQLAVDDKSYSLAGYQPALFCTAQNAGVGS